VKYKLIPVGELTAIASTFHVIDERMGITYVYEIQQNTIL
jgi:hypothetical protein